MIKKYFLVPEASVNNRVVNSSVSLNREKLKWSLSHTYAIIEASLPVADILLDFQGFDEITLQEYLLAHIEEWEPQDEGE